MAHDPEDIEAISKAWPEGIRTARQKSQEGSPHYLRGTVLYAWGEEEFASKHVLDTLTSRGWRPPEKKDADGWIEWGGGECPVAMDQIVLVRLRNGTERVFGRPAEWFWGRSSRRTSFDIIAYRVVEKKDASHG